MSSSCKCGDNCNCGSSCNCNKSFEMNYAEGNTTETVIMGVGPSKVQIESVEMGFAAESGCKCGSSCTCDPCNCK